jgi:starch-binding outer membrane protein, SusD/RagB family
MKQSILYLFKFSRLVCFFTLLLLALSSCSEKLVEAPKSIAVEVFYNTPQEVETAVNAIYSPLRNKIPEYVATHEAHSDLMYGRGSWEPLSLYQGFNDANINRVVDFWNMFYVAIRNANLVIQNAPSGTRITQADKDKYLAEAKFLRAYSYFNLVRDWASVPLRTEANMLQKDLPKSSVAEIYDFIIADLLVAEAFLPDNQVDVGRPTKWSAKTFLADVYLQLARYGDAASKANEVIQSNKYSLIRVANKTDIQNNIFGPTIVTSPEEIFYFKYSRLANQGNYLLFISNHPNTGLFNFGGAYAIHGDATNPIYVNWNDNDLRKSLFDKINFGLGPNTLVSSKWVDRNAISTVGAGNDYPVYRYADLLLIYAEAAARAEASVSAASLEALNKVRRRAYAFNPATPSIVDFTAANFSSSTAFVDSVIKERGYEFVYEGKRWLELKRTGKANQLILAAKGKTIATKHLLWPIPLSEMNYNKALNPATDQNPGY